MAKELAFPPKATHKEYIGIKEVIAKPMTREDAEKHLGRDVGGDASGEGYLVGYPGGYESWSPKDVFDEAYREHGVEKHIPTVFDFDLTEEQQELVVETKTVRDNITKLGNALQQHVINKTQGDTEFNLMVRQHTFMVAYYEILADRVMLFVGVVDKEESAVEVEETK